MSSNHKPLPEFQICPEAARFRSTEHNYPVEIRHINCPGYDEPTSGGRGATPGSSCSCDTLVEILEEPNQWMEVCPGECNETTGVSDSTITVVLHEIARTLYESAHSRTVAILLLFKHEVSQTIFAWTFGLTNPEWSLATVPLLPQLTQLIDNPGVAAITMSSPVARNQTAKGLLPGLDNL
ncbi:hypothetical protein F4825DRAFT_453929 [Nemania diffusa]|nr:hypothetical protein F4825DRAFT_453929 [Nemania diffusa]